METSKGAAWRKHNVYTKQYVDNYDRIDWSKGRVEAAVVGGDQGSDASERETDAGGADPVDHQDSSVS